MGLALEQIQRLAALEALEAERQKAEAKREARSAKRAKRRESATTGDTIPLVGTPAHAVYLAIVGDPALQPIVVNPGDFAARIADPTAYPGLDVLALVRDCGEYASRHPGKYSEGRAFIANQLRRRAAEESARPKPASPLASGAFPVPVRDRYGRPAAPATVSARELLRQREAQLSPPAEAPEVSSVR